MRTVRALAVIPVALLFLGACGSDDSPSSAGSDTTPGTTVAVDTTALDATTVPGTDATVTTEATVPETAVDGPVQIDVVVGVDSGADRVVQVKVGSDVTLNLTNPDAADEFHLHGIELEKEAAAGEMITFNFKVTEAGTYEVESHVTEDVLVVIEAT